MTNPALPTAEQPTDTTTPKQALHLARRLLAALVEQARNKGEQARAEVALAHLDDVWPLPAPADATGVQARGEALVDTAIFAVIQTVSTAPDAQARARGLRALEVISSALEMPTHRS